MQIFLVGGAVRDRLLHLPVNEHDWVVVGATEADMLAKGFIKVGKDFPVFLHPETKEEYALARTERKIGKGYYGFACHAAPDVTLEQDLQRRDITINAMAQDSLGNIIDPYHGQEDIKKRLLRHVSPAFSEDPVRILRVARFAARFAPLGFQVAEETLALMRHMVNQGEIDALVPERVWQEWQRSLTAAQPAEFLAVLHASGALARLFPQMQGTFAKTLQTLSGVATRTSNPLIRFVATTLFTHPLEILCKHYRIPNDYSELALIVQQHYKSIIQLQPPAERLALLATLDAWRRPARFTQILAACTAIFPESQSTINQLNQALAITAAIKPTELVAQGLQGAAIQAALYQKRLLALQAHE